jgi:hypothetical protein
MRGNLYTRSVLYMILSAAYFVLFLFALVDIISSDQSRIRHLDKVTWIFIVILVPIVGSIAWFVVGREHATATETVSFGDPRRAEQLGFGSSEPTQQELDALDREIALHENEARIARLEREMEARRKAQPPAEA